MAKKKSWREKLLDDKDLPKIGDAVSMPQPWCDDQFVIPAPREVDAIMRQVPRGKLITINEIRAALARKHRVSTACPMTTGIFAWIAAHAAEEDAAGGAKRITPYWRTLKTGGELNPKYPGGLNLLRKRLEAEGHVVTNRGKRMFVANYEKRLMPAAKIKA